MIWVRWVYCWRSDDIDKDVNNSFVNNKSLNDDIVSNDFVKSRVVYNEITDNFSNSLKNQFVNNFFKLMETLCDSVNTENNKTLKVFGIISNNISDTDIVMTIYLCQ